MAKVSKKHARNSREAGTSQDIPNHIQGSWYDRLPFSCLSMFFLLYVALPSFMVSVFLFLRIGPQYAYWVAVAVLSGLLFHQRRQLGIGGFLVFFGVLLASHVYAYCIFEVFFDGLTYHLPAIRRIAGGFNPIYDGYMNLGRPFDHWSDQATYFPKVLWYFSAAVTAAFGDIQFGKVYNPLLIFAALFFVLDAVRREPVSRRVLWAVACCNPIALAQIPHDLADGALSSLATISLCYAWLFFAGKPISRFQHVFCTVVLAMLFCVKTSGFAYGCIIIFFIALHGLVKGFRDGTAQPVAARVFAACCAALRRGVRLGIPVFLLVLVWGFAPYATNILEGRNIFHPLVHDGSERGGFVQSDTERVAAVVYPDAHNRVTRLFVSLVSHSVVDLEEAKGKLPLDPTHVADWEAFGYSHHLLAAGLGPLFCLLLLLSVPVPFIFRFRENGWLLATLLVLVFVQPYAWIMRFAPFLWIVPLACLLSLPEKRRAYLWGVLVIAVMNTAGVTYFSAVHAWGYSRGVKQICSHFAGETVMLPQTIFEYDGVFGRYGIKQKFINPEETNFYRRMASWGFLSGPRSPDGVNVFLKSHLPPVPGTTLVFGEETALPWLKMSEGLIPSGRSQPGQRMKWTSYDNKIKFYMAVGREPKGDWDLTLRATLANAAENMDKECDVLVSVNNRDIGTWRVDNSARSADFTIPRELLEESFRDETGLMTVMFRLQGVPSWAESGGLGTGYGIQLEEMRIRPKELPHG